MLPRMRSRSTSIASGNNCLIVALRCKSTPFAVLDTSYPRKRRNDFIQIHLFESANARSLWVDAEQCLALDVLPPPCVGGTQTPFSGMSPIVPRVPAGREMFGH